MDSLKYQLHTFGCKVNTYDSGLLEKRLDRSGFQHVKDKKPKIHILNTCAVTAEATKEALRFVRKLKVQNPLNTIVVTGCGAQVDTEKFQNWPGVDLIVANSHKGQLEDLIQKYFRNELETRVFRSNIFKKEDLESGGGLESDHTRSFLKIQDGCNSFCTYCVIPFARGKSRSIPIADLTRRVQELYEHGLREVVLTGVHIGDYEDGDKRLEDLIETLILKTNMPRFRLTSLEPVELNPRLLDLYQSGAICPHFHMSIQSANTRVLKSMKRNYGHKEVEEAFHTISQLVPGAFVGMDVIVGFPGETDEEFLDTYQRLENLPWTRIHVFPYSPRPGTLANRLEEQWGRHLIKERAKTLNQLSLERYSQEALRQVGSTKKVLILGKQQTQGANHVRALSRDYWNIQCMNHNTDQFINTQQEVEVKIIGCSGFERSGFLPHLTAERVSSILPSADI